jgi:hypothetical protein
MQRSLGVFTVTQNSVGVPMILSRALSPRVGARLRGRRGGTNAELRRVSAYGPLLDRFFRNTVELHRNLTH